MKNAPIALCWLCIAATVCNAQEQQESRQRAEIRYEMTLEATPPAERSCEATIYFTYLQRDTVAVVDSTIENFDCAASGGSYTIIVRFRDDSGQMHSLEFPETWRRGDDRALDARKEYHIGSDVDLVSVRSRRMRCVCENTAESQRDPDE